MYKQTLAALACSAALLLAAPVSAQPAIGAQSQVIVHFSDLDVTREAGAAVLLSRLQGAARTVCSAAADSRDLTRIAVYASCIKSTMDRAVAAAGVPLLPRLYADSQTAMIALN